MPRLALLLCLGGGLLVAAAPALAASHVDTSSSTVHKVSGSGTRTVYEGDLTSSAFGRGTVRQTVVIGEGLRVTGSYVVTFKNGTIRGRIKAQTKLSGGKITFAGTSKVTGGTGRYAGASGTGRYSGTANLSGSTATFSQRATISY